MQIVVQLFYYIIHSGDSPMVSENELSDEKGFGYEIFIALVSILSVFNLALVFIPGVDPEAVNVVESINLFLTIIFILDFVYG